MFTFCTRMCQVSQNKRFLHGKSAISLDFSFVCQKYAAGSLKMFFGAQKSKEHIQNNPKPAGFVEKSKSRFLCKIKFSWFSAAFSCRKSHNYDCTKVLVECSQHAREVQKHKLHAIYITSCIYIVFIAKIVFEIS